MSNPALTHAATTLGMNFQGPLQSSQDSEPTVEILPATLALIGAIKPDGTTITVAADGTISSTSGAGFPNPMTTKGDLIAGAVAGAPMRLGVGINGQVLTANSAAADGVDWETPSAGFANPMTTKGDLIAGAAGGIPARVGVGINGQVLTANSAAADGIDWETAATGTVTTAAAL